MTQTKQGAKIVVVCYYISTAPTFWDFTQPTPQGNNSRTKSRQRDQCSSEQLRQCRTQQNRTSRERCEHSENTKKRTLNSLAERAEEGICSKALMDLMLTASESHDYPPIHDVQQHKTATIWNINSSSKYKLCKLYRNWIIFKAFIGLFDRKSIADHLLCWLTYLLGWVGKTKPRNEMSFAAN